MRVRQCWSGALLIGFLLSPLAADNKNPEFIDPVNPIPSCTLVLTSRGQGSGFVIDRGERLVITNHHVARADDEARVLFPVWRDDKVFARRAFYLEKVKPLAARCLVSDPVLDLALIQVDALPKGVTELKLSRRYPLAGQRAYLLGNPGDSSQAWVHATGKVKEVKIWLLRFPGGFESEARMVVLSMPDRTVGPGASGGPAVNDDNELIGVIQSGPPDASQVNCIDSIEVGGFVGTWFRSQGTFANTQLDYLKAAAWCTRALQFNPADALAHHERGVARSFQGRYAEAAGDFTAALKFNPKLPRSWRGRAACWYVLERHDQAVADCTEAIKLDPRYAQAYILRSRAYARLGDRTRAAADRQLALQLDPTLK